MTNKELQEKLKEYPDDLIVVDRTFNSIKNIYFDGESVAKEVLVLVFRRNIK